MSHPVPATLAPLMTETFPPQRGFTFTRENWLTWMSGMPEVIEAIENLPTALDRGTVVDVFNSLWPENVPGAFVSTMIWGHGTTNYGPYRTAKVLTQTTDPKGQPVNSSVIDRLRRSVEIVRSSGPGAAYEYLNNDPGGITGLGPAFFTKWLYFASVTGPHGQAGAAPILDNLVINWLATIEPPITLRYARTPDYREYVQLLTEWGQPYNLGPAEVEERIFRIIRNDGTDTTEVLPNDVERP